jgi:hypothetical protein
VGVGKCFENPGRGSRADNSFDRQLRFFISPDLLVVDDFALKKLSGQATSDFYDLLIERHTRSATILTSDRGIEQWMAVFDDPMFGPECIGSLLPPGPPVRYRRRVLPQTHRAWIDACAKKQPKGHDLNYGRP